MDFYGREDQSRRAGQGHGLNLFRLAGIQVAIDASWVLIFLLVLWSLTAGYFPQRFPGHTWAEYGAVGLVATFLFFASVLIHEFAHALVGNRLGEEVRRITLFIFGGMAQLSSEPKSPGAEFKIAAAGPATSILLGVLFGLIANAMADAGVTALWTAVLGYLAFINVALAVFNLLPGYPLDGGRLLRAVLWKRSGDLRSATARAADWGSGIAICLMILGVVQIFGGALIGGLWIIFIAMFLRAAARAGYYSMVLEQDLSDLLVKDIMIEDPVTVSPDISVAEAIDRAFLHHGYGGFPVSQNGHVEGLLSLSSVRRCPPDKRSSVTVREIMRPLEPAIRIEPTASASEALRRMGDGNSSRLLVTRGEKVVGLVTRSGVARVARVKAALRGKEGANPKLAA
jgi:Zn-dependent protease/CBS domain-containing protein